jgi:hypothetical protein
VLVQEPRHARIGDGHAREDVAVRAQVFAQVARQERDAGDDRARRAAVRADEESLDDLARVLADGVEVERTPADRTRQGRDQLDAQERVLGRRRGVPALAPAIRTGARVTGPGSG